MAKDYYEILGVSKNATEEEIKKAYKKLAKQYHPDISKEENAEVKFKEINEAASVLLDKDKKQRYDTYGSAEGGNPFGAGGGAGFDPRDFGINLDDIFEQFGFGGFGGFGSGGRKRKQKKETNVYEEETISLEDVYFGTEVELDISRKEKCETCLGKGTKSNSDIHTCSTCDGQGIVIEVQRSILGSIRTQKICPNCNGSGEKITNPCNKCHGEGAVSEKETISIKIPKGIESGMTLRVTGKGDYDKDSKSYGDLYLKIYVEENKEYEIEGTDLYKDIKINFVQAILGDEIEFKHFNKTLSVKIPEGTQGGTVLRLKEKGLPYFNFNQQGDLYLRVIVEIPKKTSKEQKRLLMEYAKTLKDKSILDRMKRMFS